MLAVRSNDYGDVDVLDVVDVPRPVPSAGQVLVQVRAAGINPGEGTIRSGGLADKWPSTFPSGQGSDLAGVIVDTGPGSTGWAVGDEVLGFTHERASHAEYVLVGQDHLVAKPAEVSWEVAGALFVVGTTAYAALRAIELAAGETVVVSGAAGGVGSVTVQLAAYRGATVIGVAGESAHEWLRAHGVSPVAYGDGVADRIRAAAGGRIDAFVDTVGQGYVDLARSLGVPAERIDTIIDFAAAEQHGVHAEGNNDASTAEVLAEMVGLVAKGAIEIPIAATYPLTEVRAAFRELERKHAHGKIVLVP